MDSIQVHVYPCPTAHVRHRRVRARGDSAALARNGEQLRANRRHFLQLVMRSLQHAHLVVLLVQLSHSSQLPLGWGSHGMPLRGR